MRVPVPSTAAELAALIDHTLLTPEATAAQAQAMADEAVALGCASVCVSPARLPLRSDGTVCAVVGFPSGAHAREVKSAEAAYAVVSGATEIDMVLDLGAVKGGSWTDVEDDIAAVRAATAGKALLKVIIEAAALTDDEVTGACEAAGRAGADFVKTSTGFHPAGGATEHAVALMRQVVGDELGVKASGGIRTTDAALAMIAAGANRLGCSGTRVILAGLS
ncbi:MAG TPA: deoxyribose-phosphate aldolase [Mycobacteriales bacterium]|jgi:deoxyribose-phosphate aldolase|nr:deoxyribose-phosphate aldolase [Mycobacteriales bacterium]